MLKLKLNREVFIRKMGALGRGMSPYISVTARQFVSMVLEEVKERTGKTARGRTDLSDLWKVDHTKSRTREEFIIRNTYPNQDIILFREVGTKPHIIEGNPLHFFIKGKEVFTKKVRHPGTKPYFMVSATGLLLDKKADFYVDAIMNQVDKLMRDGLR